MKKYFVALMMTLISITALAGKKNNKTAVFKVYGNCGECKERMEDALHDVKGIYKANWNVDSKMMTVRFDSTLTSQPAIQKILADVGHESEGFLTDTKTYEALNACCQYERELLPEAERPVADTTHKHPAPAAKQAQKIKGSIYELDSKNKPQALAWAAIKVLGTTNYTVSDSNGAFELEAALPLQLVVSYTGLKTDTFAIVNGDEVSIVLRKSAATKLSEVQITARMRGSFILPTNPFNTRMIGTKELCKAACCNLSESFETSPSVDVNYADAVTGIKQIQLLGLAGNYTQITTENTPEIHGLSSIYGMAFIPGPWIESIQIIKGTGSVSNGYESIAGQINVEEKKPSGTEKLFVNGYANMLGRLEASANYSQEINKEWSSALLVHANTMAVKGDRNGDNFIDNPVGRQYNVINRWQYRNDKGLFSQFSLKALNDKRQTGQMSFDPKTDKYGSTHYGVGYDIAQYAFSGKVGYVFPGQDYKSIGLIVSANSYTNNAYYGLTRYDGKQDNLYANLMYQSIIGSTAHQFKTGISLVNDNMRETLNTNQYNRKEVVPGAFVEYTYQSPNEKIVAIGGFRADYHNAYGLMATPRANVKYKVAKNTDLRLSAGSGFRTANIFAENIGLFASSRQFQIINPSATYAYGLAPEKAWNYGLNVVQNFTINKRKGTVSVDVYRTDFANQVVVDVDASPQGIAFYNLNGQSYSNSIQAEMDYELIDRLDLRLAYRWLDVQTTYGTVLRQKPLQAKHRAFANLAYETKSKWLFDLTTQWVSSKRLPITTSNPVAYQLASYSPAYWQATAQVTKQFGTKWDVYVGVENITNYKQQQPILSTDQPFSPYFDGSMVWGPINGRMFYVGMRYKLAK